MNIFRFVASVCISVMLFSGAAQASSFKAAPSAKNHNHYQHPSQGKYQHQRKANPHHGRQTHYRTPHQSYNTYPRGSAYNQGYRQGYQQGYQQRYYNGYGSAGSGSVIIIHKSR